MQNQNNQEEPYPFDDFLAHIGHLTRYVQHYESVDVPTKDGYVHLDLPPILRKSPQGLALQIADYMAQIHDGESLRDYKTAKLLNLLNHLVKYASEYRSAGILTYDGSVLEAPEYVWQIFHLTLCSRVSVSEVTPNEVLPLIEQYRHGLSHETPSSPTPES